MMSERHEVKIFVHLNEPKAKKKVARPFHKVVAKDMGQKNKGSLEGVRECVQVKVANGGCAGDWRMQAGEQGLIPSAAGINIIDGVASPKWGGEACTARRSRVPSARGGSTARTEVLLKTLGC